MKAFLILKVFKNGIEGFEIGSKIDQKKVFDL